MDLTWVQWGTVPAWIGAVGTPVGLFFTARAFSRQGEEMKAENTRRREAQARQVYVSKARWGGQDVRETVDDEGLPTGDAYEVHLVRLAVQNLSAQPIHEVRAHFNVPLSYLGAKQVQSTPAVTVKLGEERAWREYVRPGPGAEGADSPHDPDDLLIWEAFRRHHLVRHNQGQCPDVWLTFRDADGVMWKRLPNGNLEELKQAPT